LLLAATLDAAVAAQTGPDVVLLKDGAPDPRFDLPNAPGLIARLDLTAKTVIQRTSNGTRGAHAVSGAAHILCASFATAAATVHRLRELDPTTVMFVPTEGDEDVALADYLAELIARPTDPLPFLVRAARSPAAAELRQRGHDARYVGVDPDDLERCLDLDRFDFTLEAQPIGELLALSTC
jgi:2-phosphosulfolactate phosphatase